MKFCTNLLSIIFFHITNPFVFTIAGIVFNDRLQNKNLRQYVIEYTFAEKKG